MIGMKDAFPHAMHSETETFDGDTIVVICAYCKNFIQTKHGHGKSGVSHGICDECHKEMLTQWREGGIAAADF